MVDCDLSVSSFGFVSLCVVFVVRYIAFEINEACCEEEVFKTGFNCEAVNELSILLSQSAV